MLIFPDGAAATLSFFTTRECEMHRASRPHSAARFPLRRFAAGFRACYWNPRFRSHREKIMNVTRKQRVPFADLSGAAAEFGDLERYKVNGKLVNIFAVLMNHPKLFKAWMRFGGYILSNEQTLSARDREIAILRIGWLNQAPYEWEQHVRIAKTVGLTDDDIDRITKGPEAGWDRHDAALVRAADDLFENSVISDQTWKTLSERYDTKQMMDLVFTIGQYNLVSWALNSLGVPLDDYLPGARK
jgi:4-carboxymuconolactone decarboxylase